jgi:uncharacterized protein (UPF0333 family)
MKNIKQFIKDKWNDLSKTYKGIVCAILLIVIIFIVT